MLAYSQNPVFYGVIEPKKGLAEANPTLPQILASEHILPCCLQASLTHRRRIIEPDLLAYSQNLVFYGVVEPKKGLAEANPALPQILVSEHILSCCLQASLTHRRRIIEPDLLACSQNLVFYGVIEPKKGLAEANPFFGAATQIRTGDLILTKDVLYQLSHSSTYIFVCHSIIAKKNRKVNSFFHF